MPDRDQYYADNKWDYYNNPDLQPLYAKTKEDALKAIKTEAERFRKTLNEKAQDFLNRDVEAEFDKAFAEEQAAIMSDFKSLKNTANAITKELDDALKNAKLDPAKLAGAAESLKKKAGELEQALTNAENKLNALASSVGKAGRTAVTKIVHLPLL